MEHISESLGDNIGIVAFVVVMIVALLIGYFVLMTRTVIGMLRYDVHGVLLTFGFISLIPLPPILVLGVVVMFIWHFHKKDIMAGRVKVARSLK